MVKIQRADVVGVAGAAGVPCVLGLIGVLEILLDVLELMPIAVSSPMATMPAAKAMTARRLQVARLPPSEDGTGSASGPVAALISGIPLGAPHRRQN